MRQFLLSFVATLFLSAPAQATVRLLDYIPASEHAAIQNYTSTYDAYPSLMEAIDEAPRGSEIVIDNGLYRLSKTVHLEKRVHLNGEGGAPAGPAISVFSFTPDTAGIVVHRGNTGPNAPTVGADGSIIEGLAISGSGDDPDAHGIWMRARAVVRETWISGFGGNGVHIVATHNSSDPDRVGNANGFSLQDVRITHSGVDGVYVDGADVNAGLGEKVSVTSNGRWGIYDSSFLGNTWTAAHASNNGNKSQGIGGPYKTDSRNARSVFVGCYSESNQAPSEFSIPTVVVGGLHAAGVTGRAFYVSGERGGRLSPFSVNGVNSQRAVQYSLGAVEASGLEINFDEGPSHGWSLGFWEEAGKTVQFKWGRLTNRGLLDLTTNLSPHLDEDGNPIGGGQLVLDGAWVRAPNNRFRYVDFLEVTDDIMALEGRANTHDADIGALQAKIVELEQRIEALEAQ